MGFRCLLKEEFQNMGNLAEAVTVDMMDWINQLIDSIRFHREKEFLLSFCQQEKLIFDKADVLEGREASQEFLCRLAASRNGKNLDTILIFHEFGQNKHNAFQVHLHLTIALVKLDRYKRTSLECPANYGGDGVRFLDELYEWKHTVGASGGLTIGQKLSEVDPLELPDKSIFNYQKDLGDYYQSQQRFDLALGAYARGLTSLVPSNYAYAYRWQYLEEIANVCAAFCSVDMFEQALAAVEKLIAETERMPMLETAAESHRAAVLKKMCILAGCGRMAEGKEMLRALLENLPEAPRVYDLRMMAEVAACYKKCPESRELLKYLAEHSRCFMSVQLTNAARDMWELEDASIAGRFLRQWLTELDRYI